MSDYPKSFLGNVKRQGSDNTGVGTHLSGCARKCKALKKEKKRGCDRVNKKNGFGRPEKDSGKRQEKSASKKKVELGGKRGLGKRSTGKPMSREKWGKKNCGDRAVVKKVTKRGEV